MGKHATNTLSLAHDKCLLDGSFMTTLVGVKKGGPVLQTHLMPKSSLGSRVQS